MQVGLRLLPRRLANSNSSSFWLTEGYFTSKEHFHFDKGSLIDFTHDHVKLFFAGCSVFINIIMAQHLIITHEQVELPR